MFISQEEFNEIVSKHLKEGDDFYYLLLIKIINNPTRFSGLFRLSNARQKLLQNITQSNEIKFGDILEEITTKYIQKLGYTIFDKQLINNKKNLYLSVDQYFRDKNSIYVVEMKVRDDHDSTKKRGQYENFIQKLDLIKSIHKNIPIKASMWFVDDKLTKNKNYYLEQMKINRFDNIELKLYYGAEFFNSLNSNHIWEELKKHLTYYKKQKRTIEFTVPDFGTSTEILNALVKLPEKEWTKLNSEKEEYVLLRDELFSSGNNIELAKQKRLFVDNEK
ncbi:MULTISPECIES: HpyAIV family type II restriction enzyme [unclassified Mycoplasma]|uniref:HpyAIV family type II restriction enzyme n=1 Tax=unclassified Mycoplasma TaxID=2683645 RepID=UPI00211C046C|nr:MULTISPECIES: hypothetical protein [unclassified Mycoplasma]UUM19689.1 hypothetical protein NPA11_02875 [Mycoplasma sp. 1578d]UUM24672.1 hypothetical protein NPA12_03170 [Mycoplasma sp. 3686d]